MSNDNSDGRNNPDGRVYTRVNDTPGGSDGYAGSGSIWEVAAAQGITADGPHIGGLYSGMSQAEAVALASPSLQSNAVRSGGPVNIGGFTATTPAGDPIINASELREDSLVTVQTPDGPVTTEYRVALQANLLNAQAQPQGRPQQQQQEQHQQQDQQDQENKGDMDKADDAVRMDEAAEQVMVEALSRDEGAVVQAASDLIESGVVGDDMLARLAAPGENPEQVHAKVQVAIEGYRGDAVRGAARHAGTDEALAYEALMANAGSPQMKQAMMDHLNRGGTRQYSQFVRDHVAAIAESAPERIITAQCAPGISVRDEGGGEIIVTIDGRSHRWQDAIQQGLVRVSSGRRGR
ncbi:MAG: hypothetical protein AB7P12_12100 [Alphaproteobacteria bacterium]